MASAASHNYRLAGWRSPTSLLFVDSTAIAIEPLQPLALPSTLPSGLERDEMSESGQVLPFPSQRPERAGIELVTRLAPSHSLVGSLIEEAGMARWDATAGMAAELTHQAGAMEACYEAETVIIKLRTLVDAQVAHAAEICLHYQEIADRLVALEIKAAQAERVSGQMRLALQRTRVEWCGSAIAARKAADAAQGAVLALTRYIRNGLAAPPSSPIAEPEQLPLFALAG